MRFFNEALPSDREPGGLETRALVESFLPDFAFCLPDTWVGALRQAAGKEAGWGLFSRARSWLERRGKPIDLRTMVIAAVDAMAGASQPDWSRLVPLGRWVLHRKRPDLLTHVLVDSDQGIVGIPVTKALVADPYVERGENRRRLYPTGVPISNVYVQGFSTEANAHEWRTLFEKAGARGSLEIRAVESSTSRFGRGHVAEFLGTTVDAVGESNASGYTLTDFHIEPPLPEITTSDSVRSALARWLEDGFSALHGKGRRKAKYFYYSAYELTGSHSCDWVQRLRDLEWVPCRDSKLRRPADVLAHPDASRDDAPITELSEGLLAVLEREGVHFGSHVSQAPALRKLIKLGSTLTADAMAALLREIRESSTSDIDAGLFADAMQGLSLPLDDGRHIPIHRIVQKAGGRLRGGLGGWIVPFSDVPAALRQEISHSDWPLAFPQTTTGDQALDYIEDVWSRARSASEGLANEVRDVLPTAYSYVLEDAATDTALSERWTRVRSGAVVFAGREWIVLSESNELVYVDDVEDRRFFPVDVRLRTATAGHLGNIPSQQLTVAAALGLRPLSSVIELDWREIGDEVVVSWTPRFELLCELLGRIRGRDESEPLADSGNLPRAVFILRRLDRLELTVRLAGAEAKRVPINARLTGTVLFVSGRPVAFASDGAKEILRGFSFRQRGDLAADLTGLFAAIDSPEDFAFAVDKFVRSHVPGFEIPSGFQLGSVDQGATDVPQVVAEGSSGGGATAVQPTEGATEGQPPPAPAPAVPPHGGSFNRDRALAAQKALAEQLRKALKGELDLEEETGDGDHDDDLDESDGSGELGDEFYREVAIKYERDCGREPQPGDPRQEGWDLESVDPSTGLRRFIEVKGKGCSWSKDEVVELSRAQVRKAFQTLTENSTAKWYLYVVEQKSLGVFEVLPILNPIDLAGKWLLRGAAWRMVSDQPREVTLDARPVVVPHVDSQEP